MSVIQHALEGFRQINGDIFPAPFSRFSVYAHNTVLIQGTSLTAIKRNTETTSFPTLKWIQTAATAATAAAFTACLKIFFMIQGLGLMVVIRFKDLSVTNGRQADRV